MSFPKPTLDLMHKVEPGQQILLFMVPASVLRVIATDDTFMTFRVEQLVITNRDVHNPRGSWHTLSTHSGPAPGSAWAVACKAAKDAQQKLLNKRQQQSQVSL